MNRALKKGLDKIARQNFELEFMYRHDSSVIDQSHPVPVAIVAVAERLGRKLETGAMTASCDAWFYNNQLGIPTVVFGPGSLKVAHSRAEQIDMNEIAEAARVLLGFLVDYCGVKK